MLSLRNLGVVGRTVRQFNRYRNILFILFKYGLGDVVNMIRPNRTLEAGRHLISRKPAKRIGKLTRAKRIRLAFEELGPTFIKLGQLLSTRSDLISGEYHRELLKLQDEVPPVSYPVIRKIIKSEFGRYPEDIFKYFEETPIAGASIGQVHKAQLRSGETVAVKIQRPDIRKMLQTDLEIILNVAAVLERNVKEFEIHKPTRIVAEFANSLTREIDYLIEAAHIERFGRQFEADNTVHVPRVYRKLTCEHIITMEYINGIKISNVAELQEKGYNLKTVVRRSADLILKQIFVHGFFHGDPHHANIFILPDNVICFLDFGMMGRVNREERENFTRMALQILTGNTTKAADSLLNHTEYLKEPDKLQLEKDLSVLIDQHLYRPLEELNIGRMFQQLLGITFKHELCFKPDLFLMIKALGTAEAVGKELDPEFDLTRHIQPFIRQVQRERYNPIRFAENLVESGSEMADFMMGVPGDLKVILEQAKKGELKIEFEHQGLNPMLYTHDRISNRIVFAIVLAALIIGSSLIVLSGVPPKWYEIPVIGLGGFIVAGIMGLWLLISIIRHGKM